MTNFFPSATLKAFLIYCILTIPLLSFANDHITSFNIDYKETVSDLCLIGAQYDTDKSSQRKNVTDTRHCHPYTLFYHSIFRDKRKADLNIAELGILHGGSLLMWREYFENAEIYGFDNDLEYLNSFKRLYDNDRIQLNQIDVKNKLNIKKVFHTLGVQFDLIIEDTTHQFQDQVRVIESVYPYLKPGGMLIVEDIFKSYNEKDYINLLKPILQMFQDYYFVTLDHKNRRSTGWDNDKLFVLVKAGGEPIFKNNKKLTLITPSMRPQNLLKVKESIDFNYVDEWIIVYDGSKLPENPNQFADSGNPKIKEYIHTDYGRSGNPQRNYALDHVQNENTYLYFVDDDNTIHKDLYKLLNILDDEKFYTFNQEKKNRIKGSRIELGYIDTAMFLIDFNLCKNIRWIPDLYEADYYYINDCYSLNKDKWIFVDNPLSTYNIIQ